MEQRPYGKNGFSVSAIGFGASHIGSDDCSEREAEVMLNAVLDSGVTLLDTARGYGKSEERIGQYLSHRRDEFILSTKCGYGIDGVPDWTPHCITRGIEEALRIMKTDRIDIMHFHSCGLDSLRQDDLRSALVTAKQQGKIRVAAYSGENDARNFALHCGDFTGFQTSLNLCDQRVLREALPVVQENGYGLIAKRPIANAFWRFNERPVGDYSEVYWERANAMQLAPPEGMSWLELAIRFTAFQPALTSMIIGTKSLENFRKNISILEQGPLPVELVHRIQDSFMNCDHHWEGQV